MTPKLCRLPGGWLKYTVIRGWPSSAECGRSVIVERDVTTDEVLGLGADLVGPQIDLFVLDRSPEPLDEYVVAPGALAVHADLNAVPLEHGDERPIGELRALIGIEYLGVSEVRDRLLDGVDAEVSRQSC